MTIMNWLLCSLFLLIVLPILIYLCVKLGTVGFYRGRKAGKDNNNNRSQNEQEA